MEKTKAVIFLIVASVLVALVVGIAFAQFAGARAANNSPPGVSSDYYPYRQQGSYPYDSGHYPDILTCMEWAWAI